MEKDVKKENKNKKVNSMPNKKTSTSKKVVAKKTSTTKANSTKSASTTKVNSTKSVSATKKSVSVKNTNKGINLNEEKKAVKVADVKPKVVKNDTKLTLQRPNMYSQNEFAGDEIRKLLIIIGAVCAVMLSFYFITEFVVKNKKEADNKPDDQINIEPDIQYENILMGSLFKQNGSEYYVFAYDEEDILTEIYNQYISTYTKKDGHLNVYKVNLSSDYNKGYVAEESYLSGDDVTKIRVKETTLIRIKDGKIYKTYEGYENIKNKLKSLSE